MVGRLRGRGRGRGGNNDFNELRTLIEGMSLQLQTLERRERAEARMEGRRNPLDSPEGLSEEDEHDEDANRVVHGPQQGKLEDRLIKALDLNSGGVRVEVSDMTGRMHADDFLDWEASIENYFEWKQTAEALKVLFVKLKLKGMALQWWKKLEEQRTRQGKAKIQTWEHMKQKLRKQFLPPDYLVTLYEKFHNFRQRDLSVEEYKTEFYNCL